MCLTSLEGNNEELEDYRFIKKEEFNPWFSFKTKRKLSKYVLKQVQDARCVSDIVVQSGKNDQRCNYTDSPEEGNITASAHAVCQNKDTEEEISRPIRCSF